MSGGRARRLRRGITHRSQRVVRSLLVERSLREIGEDRRSDGLVADRGQWSSCLASSRSSAADMGPMCEKVASITTSPCQKSTRLLVRCSARADVLFGPSVLAVKRVGAVRAAGVVELDGAKAERLVVAFVVGGYGAQEAVLFGAAAAFALSACAASMTTC